MLGVVTTTGRGEGDQLLWRAAAQLRHDGLRLAGAVQENRDRADGRRCDMDLHLLTGDGVQRISQDLGPSATGCRMDPDGLERAVALASAALADSGADLLIINKFGKQEADGRGFRPLIAEAMGLGIPVLTSVKSGNAQAFATFADGLAEHLPPDLTTILAWCRAATQPGRAGLVRDEHR